MLFNIHTDFVPAADEVTYLTAMPSSSSACQTPSVAGPDFKGAYNFNLGQNILRTMFGTA